MRPPPHPPQLIVVSLTPWNGDAADVSPTLELLGDMLEDVNSPTHGKVGDVPVLNSKF